MLYKLPNGNYNYRIQSSLNPVIVGDDDVPLLSEVYRNVPISTIREELSKRYKCSDKMYIQIKEKDSCGHPYYSKRIYIWYYLDDEKMLNFLS
jgi:hypothetical protein